jgi:hypothetical protein
MSTPRTRNATAAPRVRCKKKLIIPRAICEEMGIEVGESFKVRRLKRAAKVAKGDIVLIPVLEKNP